MTAKPIPKRGPGRPRQSAKGLNHSTIALFVLELMCMGFTLDEAVERTAEWFRARGFRRVGTSTARKAYSHFFNEAGRERNAAYVAAIEQRIGLYRDPAELRTRFDAELNELTKRR